MPHPFPRKNTMNNKEQLPDGFDEAIKVYGGPRSEAVEIEQAMENFIDKTLPKLPPIKPDLMEKLMAVHKLPQPTLEEIIERNRMYDEMGRHGLDPRDPYYTFNLASRYKKLNPSLQMIVTTPKGPEDITDWMRKAPWEFSKDGTPPDHGFVPMPVVWGQPVEHGPDSVLTRFANEAAMKEIDVSFAAQVVNQNSAQLVDEINKRMAEHIGINPELLNIPEPSPSMQKLMKDWSVQLSDAIRLPLNEAVNKFAADILLRQMRTFKAKTVHTNGGTMRQRRSRYYFTRVNKEVCVKETLLKNAYPTFMEMDPGQPEGDMVSVTVGFQGMGEHLTQVLKD